MTDAVFQRCIHPHCGATLAVDEIAFACPRCGGLVDVVYDWPRLTPPHHADKRAASENSE